MNFAEVLRAGLSPGGDRPAVLAAEGTLTHRELWARAGGFAARLEPGRPVAILSEATPDAVAASLGAMMAAAPVVPLAPGLSDEHLRDILDAVAPAVVFGRPADVDGKASLAGVRVMTELPPPAEGTRPRAVRPDDLAAILFTSGSTSRPRGVMLSHDNLVANTGSIIEALGLGAEDRAMLVLPLFYSFGASVVHTHLAVGGSVVIDRRFMFPNKVLDRMEETGCTGFAGVPSHFQILLRRSRLTQAPVPSLRWLQQAGGKLPQPFIDELRAALPGVRLFVMYGATEATARLSVLDPGELERRRGSIGRGLPGVQLALEREDGTAPPTGEVGEIVARGRNVALGYFQAPEETAATFRDGKLYTGDLAVADADGYLTIVDRAKDFLKCGGARTASKLVEEALLGLGGLVECAVLGVPDDVLGEAVVAFVVPRAHGDEAALEEAVRAHAAATLPLYLHPRQVVVLPGLPKSAAGKVLKPRLRELLG